VDEQHAQISVTDNAQNGRYEVAVDGELAGFARYRMDADRVVFFHTEVDPAYEGQGVASALARSALDDVRARGLLVTPLCPFIAAYIRRHPEYQNLVGDSRQSHPAGEQT
jgi:uncharacterized protein